MVTLLLSTAQFITPAENIQICPVSPWWLSMKIKSTTRKLLRFAHKTFRAHQVRLETICRSQTHADNITGRCRGRWIQSFFYCFSSMTSDTRLGFMWCMWHLYSPTGVHLYLNPCWNVMNHYFSKTKIAGPLAKPLQRGQKGTFVRRKQFILTLLQFFH